MTDQIVGYKGIATIDVSHAHCPYIPSQRIIFEPQPKAIQNRGMTFSFGVILHSEAYEWLNRECKWKFTRRFADNYQYRVEITFEDVGGAVEFKLMFC